MKFRNKLIIFLLKELLEKGIIFIMISKQRVLSGIKPTGQLTLGNYIGALKNFPSYQTDNEPFLFIADLHAITTPIEPHQLRKNILDLAAFYLAAGLDPKRSTLFIQSQVSAHAELNAILQNYLYMGELSRMTQFKEKSLALQENGIGLGLFTYPVLMAADILLYDAKWVPVGEDQIQHIELTRDVVKRFNQRYGDILVMPEAKITKVGARIMSLSEPNKKMSKSDPKGDIFLNDDPSLIRKKIMSAVTDSESVVRFDINNKPGISNLLTILSALSGKPVAELEGLYNNANYGAFKTAVADEVLKHLIPLQTKQKSIIESGYLQDVLKQAALKANQTAQITLQRVKKAVGLPE
jgi:tryptophanyl-tRNA synthetase